MRKINIILASKSPRRKQILRMCGFEPSVVVSECDESKVKAKTARELVKKLSCLKAETVAEKCVEGDLIIAADTIVSIDGEILGKPKTKKEAFEMIHRIQGRTHDVYTGVTLIYIKKKEIITDTFVEKTPVTVSPMTNCEIREYINTGEPMDKAGGYGIQGIFGKYIPKVCGDAFSVAGLPMARTYRHMKEMIK